MLISLDDVRAARERIAGKVRLTPVMRPTPTRIPVPDGIDFVLKLESLQVTGSFKARGAMNKLATLGPAELEKGLVTASGGNHGAAVAYAGWVAGRPSTVYCPKGVAPLKIEKIRGWGAALRIEGEFWDEANRAALLRAERLGQTYVHPFADPLVMAGNGTVGLELLEQIPDLDTVLVAIGGGGLIAGMAVAIKTQRPEVRLIGVEPVGSPTLHASIARGEVVTLPTVTTTVQTMACRRTEPVNLEIVRAHVDTIVLVEDEAMRAAARALWTELGIAADLSGAASLAALLSGEIAFRAGERVCALICGAGSDAIAPG